MSETISLLACIILGIAVANAQDVLMTSQSVAAVSTTVSQSMPPAATQGFDISLVTTVTLFNWCTAQTNTCPQMCGGSASANSCDTNTLGFVCRCANGTIPDSSAFQQTIPYFICQENYSQCIARNNNDAQAQESCRDNHQCGTRNATAEAIAGLSAAQSVTSSSTLGTSSLDSSSTSSRTSSMTASLASSAFSSSPSPSPGLSSGASAGIGVGAALIVIGVIAAVLFLFKERRRDRKNKTATSQPQDYPEISSFHNPTGKSEGPGDLSGKYGFTTTVQHKPDTHSASSFHRTEGNSAMSNGLWSTDGRYELHEDSTTYQRNGEPDAISTRYDEKNGCDDDKRCGGPGAANSDVYSTR